MARLFGVEIPDNKTIAYSLTYIHGIGLTTSKKILNAVNIEEDKKTRDLSADELKRIYEYIDKNIPTEGQVKQKVFNNIKRLRDIRSYRGSRHKRNLPVRGQNTRGNSRTRKGKVKMAVGGLKKVSGH